MEKMITQLNEFLSDLEMFNIKLQNYHWNVVGKGFFTTHEKLEEYYNEIREQIDEIAEHILILGYQPVGTMKEFIENSDDELDVIRYNHLLQEIQMNEYFDMQSEEFEKNCGYEQDD